MAAFRSTAGGTTARAVPAGVKAINVTGTLSLLSHTPIRLHGSSIMGGDANGRHLLSGDSSHGHTLRYWRLREVAANGQLRKVHVLDLSLLGSIPSSFEPNLQVGKV
jgi:hypothetical protein